MVCKKYCLILCIVLLALCCGYADATMSVGRLYGLGNNEFYVPIKGCGNLKVYSIALNNDAKLKLKSVSGDGYQFLNGVVNSTTSHPTPNTTTPYISVQLVATSVEKANAALEQIRYVVGESGALLSVSGSSVGLKDGDYFINGHYYTLSSSGTMTWQQAMNWCYNLQNTMPDRYPGYTSHPVTITSEEENQMLVNIWSNTASNGNPKRQVYLPAIPVSIVNPSSNYFTFSLINGVYQVEVTGKPTSSQTSENVYGHGDYWQWMTGTPEAGEKLPYEPEVTASKTGKYWASSNPTNGGMVYFGHPTQGAVWDDLTTDDTYSPNVWNQSLNDTFYGHIYGLAEWEPTESADYIVSKVELKYVEDHEHTWTYEAEDNKIIAKCSFDDCWYHYFPKATVEVGFMEKTQINFNVNPEGASLKVLEWESSDTTVVEVDENGVAWAINYGTAVVTGRTKDGSGQTTSCVVHVIPKTT